MGQLNETRFIKDLRQIVQCNFNNEQFGVGELASEYGLSRSQLHKKLKKVRGKSVSQFIREVRLEAAMKLLLKEENSVSEIAYKVGFSSPTYFNTCFKEHYGYPPGEAVLRTQVGPEKKGDVGRDQVSSPILSRRNIVFMTVLGLLLLGLTGTYFLSDADRNMAGDTAEDANRVIAIPSEKSIAVLPLKNRSEEPDYYSDGMTEAIISRLTKINAIEKVIPFASVSAYKDTEKGLPELSGILSVNYILGGSFELAGDKLMIKLQLIDAPNNNQIWSTEYSGIWKIEDIFEIQAAVAENVAQNLEADITEMEFEEIQKLPTNNIEAYTLFLQAKYLFDKLNESNYQQIISLYKKALALDPDFIEATLGLSITYFYGGLFWGLDNEQDSWKKAKVLITGVLDKDPINYRAHGQLFYGSFYFEWDWAVTERYYLEGYPGNNQAFKGSSYYAIITGRAEDALFAIENNLASDPSDRYAYVQKADALFFAGKEKSSDSVVRNYQAFYLDNFYYLIQTARLHYYLQNYEALEHQLNLLHNLMQKDSISKIPIVEWLDLMLMMHKEDSAGIDSAVDRLIISYNDHKSGSPAWFLALYYAAEKEFEQAISWLQKSYELHEVEMVWLREEPLLKPLWDDPRYLDIYNKMGWPMPPNRVPE